MYTLKQVFILTSFFGILFIISCKPSNDTDPCATQNCLNGGDCLYGDCQCPPGYTGEHCEIKITRFDCVNGNCIEVGPNGEFTTKAECQAACPAPTARFDCVNGDCIEVGPNGEFTTKAECQAACPPPPAVGNLAIRNNAPTPVRVTINGETFVLETDEAKEFQGLGGSKLKGTAEAVVVRLDDQKTNQDVKVSWPIDVSLPMTYSTPAKDYNLDVPSKYFFLRIKNYSNKAIDHVSVNSTSTPTVRTFNIPNDAKWYNVGYFDAKPNTTITTWPGTANQWIGLTWKNNEDFTLPFTKNQTVEMVRVN